MAARAIRKVPYQLVPDPSGSYRLLDPSSKLVYTFSSAGTLQQIADRNGNVLTITSSADGPTFVDDGCGRTLRFTYLNGALQSVEDQTSRKILFTQTGGNLTAVTDPLARIARYAYTTSGGGIPWTGTIHNTLLVSIETGAWKGGADVELHRRSCAGTGQSG